jgi:superfamily II DNA or RNA helicase
MMPSCKLVIKDEVNLKIEGLPVEIRRKLVNKFKYVDPTARYRPAYQLGRWDGAITLFGMGGNGYLNQLPIILAVLEECNYEVSEIEDLRKPLKLNFNKVTNTYWADQGKLWGSGHRFEGEPIMLRDDQVEVVNRFIENPQSLQEVATGAGKTIMTATLAQLCEPYGRTMIIVPNKDLVTQTEEDFKNVNLDVGVYYGDRKELNKTHTICTWQSLNILDKKSKNSEHEIVTLAEFLDGVECVIVDEVHMAKANVLKNLLTQNFCNAAIRWGLTGTVPKEDFEAEVIFASIGPVVGGIKAHQLQEMGILSNLHVNITQLIDLPEFKSYADELKYLVTNKNRIAYISNLIKKISETGNTLVLVSRIDTGTQMAELIEDSNFISGEVKGDKRKEEYKEHANSNKKITVATYGVASVGINIPRIFNLVLLESGKSFTRVIQSIGRGIRKAEDKDFVQVWDITSTCKYAKRHLTERKKYYKDAKYPFTLEKIDWEKQ